MTPRKLNALVTGGARGIGLAVVNKFINSGYNFVSTGRSPGFFDLFQVEYHKLEFLERNSLSNFIDLVKDKEITQAI